MKTTDKSRVVILRSFPTVGEAMIYKTLLESSGVECALINEVTSDMLPLQNELMPIRLIVSEEDAEKAEEILSAKFDQQEFDVESMKRHKKP